MVRSLFFLNCDCKVVEKKRLQFYSICRSIDFLQQTVNIACRICFHRFFLSSTISVSACAHLFDERCFDRSTKENFCPQCPTSITAKSNHSSLLENYILEIVCSFTKLYLIEPLCHTQVPFNGDDSSERLEVQQTKIMECEQRYRKTFNDLQRATTYLLFFISKISRSY